MNLPPVLRQRYFDSNGVPLAGGLLYTYQAGTTTPQAAYTDQGGLTPAANPIVLNANGEADMWLDPSLSYKFVLKDSSGNLQWTEDNVIGLLTINAVTTQALQDGCVTSAKLATGAVNAAALETDGSVDANRPVNTNNIRNSAITTAKIADSAVTYQKLSGLLPPTNQSLTSGSGTYNKTYLFQVTGANATAAATYTVSAVTYTVSNTISSGSLLQMTGASVPPSSGTLTRASGSGDATIAYTAVAAPLYLKIKSVGGGGGGGGSNNGGSAGGTGGTGGNTTFGTSLITANGGVGGGGSGGAAGAGGTATIGTGAYGIAFSGQSGSIGGSGATQGQILGVGGSSPFGGAGTTVNNTGVGGAAATNTGSGGAGSNEIGGGGTSNGSGGGAGGYIEAIITSPAATYGYAVGAAGAGGTAGSSGAAGGAGAAGLILVEEHYQ